MPEITPDNLNYWSAPCLIFKKSLHLFSCSNIQKQNIKQPKDKSVKIGICLWLWVIEYEPVY